MSELAYPLDWETKTTLELFYIKGRLGWKGLRASEFIDEGPFLVTGTDFENGKVNWRKSFKITHERFVESPEIIVKESDILITKDGTIGKVAYVENIPYPGEASLNSHLFLVRVKREDVEPRFVYYIFNSVSFHEFIESKKSGSTLAGLPQRVFEQFLIPIPRIKEQQKIAKILTTVDSLIEKTEALIEKYQAIQQGMIHDLFTRGIDTSGQLRPSHHDAHHLYKKTELGWIPKEWDVVKLADVASVDRGKFTHRPRDDARCYGGRLPFIQTGDVTKSIGGFLKTYSQTLSEFGASVSRSFPPGTIAVTIAANIADTAILGTEMYFPDSVVGVVPKPGIQARYLELCVRRNKRRLDAIAPLSAQKNINLEDLRPLRIALPNEEEREAICFRYETMYNNIENEKVFLSKLLVQKKGLMQDLLTGKARVTL